MGQDFSGSAAAPEFQRFNFRFNPHPSAEKFFESMKSKVEKEVRLCSCFSDLFCCSFCKKPTRGFFVYPCFHSACNECYAPVNSSTAANCPICKKFNVKGRRANLTLYALSTLAMKMRKDELAANSEKPLPALPLSLKLENDLMVRFNNDQNFVAVNALKLILLPLARFNPSLLLPLAHTCTSLYRAAKAPAVWREACFPGTAEETLKNADIFKEKCLSEPKTRTCSWLSEYFQQNLLSPFSTSLFISVTGIAFESKDWTFFFETSNYSVHCVNNHHDYSVDFIPGTTSLICRVYHSTFSFDIINKTTAKKRLNTSSYRTFLAQVERRLPIPSFGFSVYGESSGQIYMFADGENDRVHVMTNHVCATFEANSMNSTKISKNEFKLDELTVHSDHLLYPKNIPTNLCIPLIGADKKEIKCVRHCFPDFPTRTVVCPVCLSCSLYGNKCLFASSERVSLSDCGCGYGSESFCTFCKTCVECLLNIEPRERLIKATGVPIEVAAQAINNSRGNYNEALEALNSK